MDPDDAPPRLRWRLLAWLAGALLLLPVLYVAMVGPLAWWSAHHFHTPDWINDYDHTLGPLYDQPQIGNILLGYQNWSAELPAPRSMRRQYLVDRLTYCRANVEKTRREISEAEGQLAAFKLRLEALDSRTDLTREQFREASELRTDIARHQIHLQADLEPHLSRFEGATRAAEDALRQFDRGKR